MLRLQLSNEFLYRQKHFNTFQNSRPIYFAIPVVAYKVNYIEHTNPENIIEITIFKLKKLGYSSKRIAQTLCLDERLVNSVLEYYQSISTQDDETMPIVREESKTAYVFYDCLSEQYINRYMEVKDFLRYNDLYIYNQNPYSVRVKQKLSDSRDMFVHVLNSSDFNFGKYSRIEPKEDDIAYILGTGKKIKINNEHYVNVEYLNERKNLYLICDLYLDPINGAEISVAHPIYGDKSQAIKTGLLQILAKEPQSHEKLRQSIDSLLDEGRVSRTYYSETRKEIEKKVLFKYSKDILQYEDLKEKLVSFENDYELYVQAVSQKASNEVIEELTQFQTSAHHLLEHIFKISFLKYEQEDVIMGKKLIKQNYPKEKIRALISMCGFEGENEEVEDFIRKVDTGALKKIFSLDTDRVNKNIGLWFVVNLIYASYDPNNPIIELAEKAPNLIQSLQKTLLMRNTAAHKNKDKIIVLSSREVKTLYDYCVKIAEIMLKLKVNVGEYKESDTDEAIAQQNTLDSQANLFALERIRNFKSKDEEFLDAAKTLCRSYYLERDKFYFDASNYLVTLYRLLLRPIYDDSLLAEVLKDLVDDVDANLAYINDMLLAGNGIKYHITSVVNLKKLKWGVNDHASLTALMYLYILFVQKQDPLQFKNLDFLPQLFAITDRIVEERGHEKIVHFEKEKNKIVEILKTLLNLGEQVKEADEEI